MEQTKLPTRVACSVYREMVPFKTEHKQNNKRTKGNDSRESLKFESWDPGLECQVVYEMMERDYYCYTVLPLPFCR